MIVGAKAGIPYASYFVEMLPLGVIGIGLTALWLCFYFRAELQPRPALAFHEAAPAVDWRLLYKSSAVMGLVVAGFLLGYDLAGSAVLGASILIAVASRPPRPLLEKLDWPLLLFFAGLFVVVQGVSTSGLTGQVAASLVSFRDTAPVLGVPLFSLVSLLGSNLFSNVPFVLVVSESLAGLSGTGLLWKALAVSSTLAGNLTLVGSVANLIVFEGGREVARVSFWEYLRVGAPLTLLTTALGALWIVAVHWLS
jgi:Na+/H+ antiporter NhaD/arsenite permease-like protein